MMASATGALQQQPDAVQRIERHQHQPVRDDGDRADHRQHQEPHDHDRAEQRADLRGAATLNRRTARR